MATTSFTYNTDQTGVSGPIHTTVAKDKETITISSGATLTGSLVSADAMGGKLKLDITDGVINTVGTHAKHVDYSNGRLDITVALGSSMMAGGVNSGSSIIQFDGGARGRNFSLNNAGVIDWDPALGASVIGARIIAENAGAAKITNTGTISSDIYIVNKPNAERILNVLRNETDATLNGGYFVNAPIGGVDERAGMQGTVTWVYNKGTLNGNVIMGAGNDKIINRGTITGSNSYDETIDLGQGDNVVRNWGTISGPILMEDGDDLFKNTGNASISGFVSTSKITDFAAEYTDANEAGASVGATVGGSSVSGGVVSLGGGADIGHGGNMSERMLAGAGRDTLFGNAGDDTLWGGSGNDKLLGGDGDDEIDGDADNDSIWGGSGNDTVYGGAGNDRVFAQDGDDVFYGGSGDDTMKAQGGNDYADAGDGHDTLSGALGRDTLFGGNGNDSINGGDDIDSIRGDAGDDFLVGGDGTDWIYGGDDNDNIRGDAGADTLYGDAGDDTIYGGAENDTINGGDGNDKLMGEDGDDLIVGRAGDDMIHTGTGNHTVEGNEGNDTIYASEGNDTIYAGADDDQVSGRDGDDVVHGDAGNDKLSGHTGADRLYGGDGDDTINGGDGSDFLYGYGSDFSGYEGDATTDLNGNDVLIDRLGGAEMYGGGGDDKLIGGDIAEGSFGSYTLDGGTGNDTISSGNGYAQITGGAGGDTITLGTGGANVVYHAASDSVITEGDMSTRDVIKGFTSGQHYIDLSNMGIEVDFNTDYLDWFGTDAFDGTNRGVRITDWETGTQIEVDDNGDGIADMAIQVVGTTLTQNDVMGIDLPAPEPDNGGGDGNPPPPPSGIFGTEGNDDMTGTSGNDQIFGMAGDDTLTGGDGGNDYLDGGDGSDTLIAMDIAGTFSMLHGGGGGDQMTGGAGEDSFDFMQVSDSAITEGDMSTRDVIHNFTSGVDKLIFWGLGTWIEAEERMDAIDWFGTGAFDGVNAGLRITDWETGTQIEVDHDADGIADMAIQVVGTTLTVDDFLGVEIV